MKDTFKGKQIAVVGAGIEGQSSARFLREKGARVTILDQNQGENYLENLKKYDLVVRSPGVKPSTLRKFAPEQKVTSQTKLFFDLCPGKIIGVTGTKGKGTTSSLIYEMLKKEGKDSYLVGNIGQPGLDILDKLSDQSIVVFELSSFQLQDLRKSPNIAVVLMITSEHLDYHKDVYEYVSAKRNLLRFQTANDYAVVNYDYPVSNESDIHTEAKVFKISREQELPEDGAYLRDGIIWLRKNGKEMMIIDAKEVLLPGRHNLENVSSAVVAASLCGVSKENIVSVLKSFEGLEHRLELVDTVKGVRYYDDSFSTTPETAIAAVEAFEDPEILILGGSSKNSDFSQLGQTISEAGNIKAIIGLGGEWEKIKSQITSSKRTSFFEAAAPKSQILLIEGSGSMEQAVLAASKIAEVGDVVLLSPACASFDLFKNYKDRGEQFKNEVHKLRLALN